jgi:hypothetical protein
LQELGFLAEVVPCDLGCAQTEYGDLYVVPYGMETLFEMQDQMCIKIKNVLSVEEVKQKLIEFLEAMEIKFQ